MTQSNTGRRDSGIPLLDLEADARVFSPEEFADRHCSGFLLASDAPRPVGPGATQVEFGDEPHEEATAGLSLVAYPVGRSERSVGHLIALGRTSNNDIVITDTSVSRFHAFLKESVYGGFAIQDAGSTNGTTVNGASVLRQGQGPAVDLKSGDNVRVGQVELTFLDAGALQEFILAGAR